MSRGKTLVTRGAETATSKQESAGGNARFTAVPLSGSDGAPRAPEFSIKWSNAGRTEDAFHVPAIAPFRVSLSASHSAELAAGMIRDWCRRMALSQAVGMSGRKFRALVTNQFGGQLTVGVSAEMISANVAPVGLWGHLAPPLQLADRYQDKGSRAKYCAEEALQIASLSQKYPTGAPKPT